MINIVVPPPSSSAAQAEAGVEKQKHSTDSAGCFSFSAKYGPKFNSNCLRGNLFIIIAIAAVGAKMPTGKSGTFTQRARRRRRITKINGCRCCGRAPVRPAAAAGRDVYDYDANAVVVAAAAAAADNDDDDDVDRVN